MQLAFLDFEAAFDSPHRGRLFNALHADGVPGDSKPQEMKWSFILCFIALICAGVLETVAGDSINRPWMGGFPTDSPAPQ
ncbi:hypothetical protein RB195_019838 [Necator americanus]|uniref:Reverse transcriptase domain-containing protein n=1 Tax=Necator americanus TaxID=51031 RepID=A0ABR1CHK4_NECAM